MDSFCIKEILPYRFKMLGVIIVKILGTGADLALPFILAYIIDNCVGNDNPQLLYKMGVLMFFVALSGFLTNGFSNFYAAKISSIYAKHLRNGLFQKIQAFSFAELDRIGTPSLITRITNDVNNVSHIALMGMRIIIRAPILFFGGMVMAFFLDAGISLILVCSAPMLFFIIIFGMKKTIPLYEKLQKAMDSMTLVMRESLTGFKFIKALSTAGKEQKKYADKSQDVMELEVKAGWYVSIVNPLMTLVMNLGLGAAVWFGGVKVNVGDMTSGEIIAYVNYFLMILNALLVINRIFIGFTRSKVSAGRIDEIMNIEPIIKDLTSQPVAERKGEGVPLLEFRDVSFKYSAKGKLALKNISFTINRGERLAIIGATGSGKTTIASLIFRFYETTSGKILIDGVDIKDYPISQLRNKLSIALQQAVLFSQTIEENIRWGKAGASEEEVTEAAKIAQAYEFVTTEKEGFSTLLTQGGLNLSGGQRQRLSIARAVVKKPELIIFDDSSSALDYYTDLSLRKALNQSLKDSAIIIIAQRISSVMGCDKIIVMENGEATGMGNHEELLISCPTYNQIYKSQMEKVLAI